MSDKQHGTGRFPQPGQLRLPSRDAQDLRQIAQVLSFNASGRICDANVGKLADVKTGGLCFCRAGFVPQGSKCSVCTAGNEPDASGAICQKCNAGKATIGAGQRCAHCIKGKQPNAGRTGCDECVAGYEFYAKTKVCGPKKYGTPANVSFSTRVGTTSTFGSSTAYNCFAGFLIGDTSSIATQIQCNSSGMWTTAPTCKPRDCKAPGSVKDAVLSINGTTFGSPAATFTGNSGFVGGGKIECKSNGDRANAPTCTKAGVALACKAFVMPASQSAGANVLKLFTEEQIFVVLYTRMVLQATDHTDKLERESNQGFGRQFYENILFYVLVSLAAAEIYKVQSFLMKMAKVDVEKKSKSKKSQARLKLQAQSTRKAPGANSTRGHIELADCEGDDMA